MKVTGSPFGTDSVHAGALAFHPNGRFVYGASGVVSGFSIDVDSGALRALAGTEVDGGGSDPMAIDLAIDPSGRFLYAVRSATGALDAYAIDPTSGALTPSPALRSTAVHPRTPWPSIATDGSCTSATSTSTSSRFSRSTRPAADRPPCPARPSLHRACSRSS
jgi:Lactonase, 7-bladed beta-propeller